MKTKNIRISLYLLIIAFTVLLILPSQPASAAPYYKNKESLIINGTQTVTSESTPDEENTRPLLQGISSFWDIYSKSKTATSYGSWQTATASKKSNTTGTLSYSKSFTSSNSYSGSLKVPKSKLNASIGFNVTKETTETSSFSVKVKKNKSYKIYYRRVYTNYKVKQRRVNINTWTGQKYYTDYANVYPKKYSHIQFKAVES
ncbi:TPA: hypothetical protein ACSJYH_003111 [Listeria monocytogenes]